ncbi:GntR family transcriptional regulator [Lachnospiraceae bacterium YH-ros2228]|nr:GntR family transcriptional regulator [Lachnospiraceae bacterium]MDD6450179.1 GntR family transcriptional regulator [Lachnospiraceae bacterium]
MNFLDYQDPRPIYEQIADMYQKLILKGALSADEPMPSVRKLAVELSTNPNTVQKAYALLEQKGFIYSVKGRGNFVKVDPELRKKRKAELKAELEEIFLEAEEVGISRTELLEDDGKDGEQ